MGIQVSEIHGILRRRQEKDSTVTIFTTIYLPCPNKSITGCSGEAKSKEVLVAYCTAKEGRVRPIDELQPGDLLEKVMYGGDYQYQCQSCRKIGMIAAEDAGILTYRYAPQILAYAEEFTKLIVWWLGRRQNGEIQEETSDESLPIERQSLMPAPHVFRRGYRLGLEGRRRRSPTFSIPDKAELLHLVFVSRYSLAEIAENKGVSTGTVSKWLRHYEITIGRGRRKKH